MERVSPRQHSRFPGDENLPTLVFIHGVYHDSWAFEGFKHSFIQQGYQNRSGDSYQSERLWETPR